MTTKTLSFKSLPSLAIAEGDTSPNPGSAGVWAWSTTLSKPVYWTGSLWTAGSSGSGSITYNSGTLPLDFGSYPGSNQAAYFLSGQTAITSNSQVKVYVSANATSVDHTANDHIWLSNFLTITVSDVIPGSGFVVYGTSIHKLQGVYTINYTWS